MPIHCHLDAFRMNSVVLSSNENCFSAPSSVCSSSRGQLDVCVLVVNKSWPRRFFRYLRQQSFPAAAACLDYGCSCERCWPKSVESLQHKGLCVISTLESLGSYIRHCLKDIILLTKKKGILISPKTGSLGSKIVSNIAATRCSMQLIGSWVLHGRSKKIRQRRNSITVMFMFT